MRVVCFSDTHGHHSKLKDVPDGDILIFAGDYTYDQRDEIKQLSRFNKWLGTLPHKHKIMIAGNHDWLFEREHYLATGIVTNAIYLNDSSTTIGKLKVWGSPVTPAFNNWAFNRQRGSEIKRHWNMIPDDTNILVTHGPSRGVLDWDARKHLGCDDLAATLCKLHNLKLHVFGHIHSGHGQENNGGVQYVNGACGYWWHHQWNQPIVVDIDDASVRSEDK